MNLYFIDKNIKKVFDEEIKKLQQMGRLLAFSDNNMQLRFWNTREQSYK